MKSAGKLDLEWIEACKLNETEDDNLSEWICRWGNWWSASVEPDGSVYVDDGSHGGRWLDQDECDQAMLDIDRGV